VLARPHAARAHLETPDGRFEPQRIAESGGEGGHELTHPGREAGVRGRQVAGGGLNAEQSGRFARGEGAHLAPGPQSRPVGVQRNHAAGKAQGVGERGHGAVAREEAVGPRFHQPLSVHALREHHAPGPTGGFEQRDARPGAHALVGGREPRQSRADDHQIRRHQRAPESRALAGDVTARDPLCVAARLITGCLLLVALGCSTWQPVADTRHYVSTARPGRLWVTPRGEGTPIVLTAPRLIGDTLVGFVNGEYREYLLAAVDHVRVRRPARGRTVLLAAGVVAGGAALVALLASAGPAGRLPTPEDPPSSPPVALYEAVSTRR